MFSFNDMSIDDLISINEELGIEFEINDWKITNAKGVMKNEQY